MGHHGVLEALYGFLVEDEIKETHVLVHDFSGLVFGWNPCHLRVKPCVVVVKSLHFVHFHGIV